MSYPCAVPIFVSFIELMPVTLRCKLLKGMTSPIAVNDLRNTLLQVLVEPDHKDWQKREWLKVNHHYNAFLVESGVVLAQRSHPKKGHKKCWWPCLVSRFVLVKFLHCCDCATATPTSTTCTTYYCCPTSGSGGSFSRNHSDRRYW